MVEWCGNSKIKKPQISKDNVTNEIPIPYFLFTIDIFNTNMINSLIYTLTGQKYLKSLLFSIIISYKVVLFMSEMLSNYY